MKTFFQTFCFVIISLVVVTESYAQSYRVRGEVYYEKGQNKMIRSISSAVVSEVPIIIKQGEQFISLLFIIESPPSNKYSLTVSLSSNPKTVGGFSTKVLTKTFQSSLVDRENGPLEFETEQNGIKIGGAVAISLKR